MSNLKQPKIESKQYRAGAKGQKCTHMSCTKPHTQTTVSAHYSGIYAPKLGKGSHVKAHDTAIADFCGTCHTLFDEYREGRNFRSGCKFLIGIFETMGRRVFQGLIWLADADETFDAYLGFEDWVYSAIEELELEEALPKQLRQSDTHFEPLFDVLMAQAVSHFEQVHNKQLLIKGFK